MRRFLNKLYYALKYPAHQLQTIKLFLLRRKITKWSPVWVTPSGLKLGHDVAVDRYLMERVGQIQKGKTPVSEGGPIRVHRGIVLDGNGRVMAYKLAKPHTLILVWEGEM